MFSANRKFLRNEIFVVLALTGSLISPPSFAIDRGTGPAAGGTPITIEGLHFTQVSVGETFAMGLTNIGTVYTWGDNSYGELGNGTNVGSLSPVQVLTAADTPLENISEIAAGASFGLALTTAGTVYAWGSNATGQLGINSLVSSSYAVQVQGVGGTGNLSGINALEANGSSAYALKGSTGEVYAWGKNTYGQLGINSTKNWSTPVFVRNESDNGNLNLITKISAGVFSMYALGDGGQVWAWGRNHKMQLGDTSITQRNLPSRTQFDGNDLTNIQDISGGEFYAVALGIDGAIYTWGTNVNGSTGLGTLVGNSDVSQVQGIANAINVYASSNVAFALLADGSFYSWGSDVYQMLGDGNVTRDLPTLVTPTVPLESLVDGTTSMLGLDASGNIYGWGSNTSGLIGDGTTDVRPTPVLGANFIPSKVTFDGTDGTNLSTAGTNWNVTSPSGTASSTVPLLGYASLRTASTLVSTVSFDAGTFTYEAAPVATPSPDPTTPSPDPTPSDTATPSPDPVPSDTATPEPSSTYTTPPTPEIEQPQSPTLQSPTSSNSQTVAPKLTTAPRLTGKAKVKQQLTSSITTTDGATNTYQWFRCSKQVKLSSTSLSKKSKCVAITGATDSTYSPVKKDKSKYLLSRVTATNSAGSSTIYSASTSKVK